MQNYCNIVKNKLNTLISGMEKNFFHGYRLYAVDGNDVYIPALHDDNGIFYCANDKSKGYNLMHLNALYDLMNRRYMDAVLQDSRDENENKALISMIENIQHDSIITADKNFDSYNNIAHLENKGMKYVIHIKSTTGIIKKFNLPLNKEADFEADIFLTRKLTKKVKENSDKYRFFGTNSTFDFLPQDSENTYPLKFRIIGIKISDDKYETLVTNLWEKDFSAEDIKKIYKLRWGIETSFRNLKYHVGLIAFHTKKKDCMIQEIFTSLIMYNFSMLITENILMDDDKHNKYSYLYQFSLMTLSSREVTLRYHCCAICSEFSWIIASVSIKNCAILSITSIVSSEACFNT